MLPLAQKGDVRSDLELVFSDTVLAYMQLLYEKPDASDRKRYALKQILPQLNWLYPQGGLVHEHSYHRTKKT